MNKLTIAMISFVLLVGLAPNLFNNNFIDNLKIDFSSVPQKETFFPPFSYCDNWSLDINKLSNPEKNLFQIQTIEKNDSYGMAIGNIHHEEGSLIDFGGSNSWQNSIYGPEIMLFLSNGEVAPGYEFQKVLFEFSRENDPGCLYILTNSYSFQIYLKK